MKFPKRAQQHIAESESMAIFRDRMPKEWVPREIAERDYGIDMYVELVGKDGYLVGHLAALQLKGIKKVRFYADSSAIVTVKRETLNYWLGLPIPVFLIVVCLDSKNVYWVNIKEQNREGRFSRDSKRVSVRVRKDGDFSPAGVAALWLAYIRERRWPEIENSIEKSLMLFNTLGPLVLMCRRGRDEIPCTTTIQYLVNQHYEHYTLLSRYLLLRKPKCLPHWYSANVAYARSTGLPISPTLYHHTLKMMLGDFLRGYRDCIIAAYELVTKRQSAYFSKAMPYLSMHLRARPHTFIAGDWYARFYYDEYESETQQPEYLYFEDFEEFDRVLDDLTRT